MELFDISDVGEGLAKAFVELHKDRRAIRDFRSKILALHSAGKGDDVLDFILGYLDGELHWNYGVPLPGEVKS